MSKTAIRSCPRLPAWTGVAFVLLAALSADLVCAGEPPVKIYNDQSRSLDLGDRKSVV